MAVIIPQTSKGLIITVEFGSYNATGQTAVLLLTLNVAGETPVTVPLTLTVSVDGSSGSYTMTGTEFTTPGYYDAQVKYSTGGGNNFYSPEQVQAVLVQATHG